MVAMSIIDGCECSATTLQQLIPQNARVLDVGCGDGLLDHLMLQKRPDIELQGSMS